MIVLGHLILVCIAWLTMFSWCFSLISFNTLYIAQCGYPFLLLKHDRMYFNSISRYWSVEKMCRLLVPKFVLFPTSICLMRKNSIDYINQNSFFTVYCCMYSVQCCDNYTSKNGMVSFSISIVNLIILWKLFNAVNTWFVESIFAKQIVSFTYLFHILILFSRCGIMAFLSSTIKIFVSNGLKVACVGNLK